MLSMSATSSNPSKFAADLISDGRRDVLTAEKPQEEGGRNLEEWRMVEVERIDRDQEAAGKGPAHGGQVAPGDCGLVLHLDGDAIGDGAVPDQEVDLSA